MYLYKSVSIQQTHKTPVLWTFQFSDPELGAADTGQEATRGTQFGDILHKSTAIQSLPIEGKVGRMRTMMGNLNGFLVPDPAVA
jgi:hypothetical protein